MNRKLLVTVSLLAVIVLAMFVPLGENASAVHDKAFDRSVGAFAIAKGLNAVISVIQGTEINASPAGVGVTITVGEILDPMNDLIERFSWIMLASSVSLGIQKILLSFSELLWLKLCLSLFITSIMVSVWYRPFQKYFPITLIGRAFIVLLILRFGAVGSIYLEEMIYDHLMQKDYQVALVALNDTKTDLDTIAIQSKHRASMNKEQGILDSIGNSIDQMQNFFDIETRLTSIKGSLEDTQKEVLNLITIFVLLNILIPILFLWITLSLLRWAIVGSIDKVAIRTWLYQ